jgi:hypothetical protein
MLVSGGRERGEKERMGTSIWSPTLGYIVIIQHEVEELSKV